MKKIIISLVLGMMLISLPVLAASKQNFNELTGVEKMANPMGYQNLRFFSPDLSPIQAIGKILLIIIGLIGVIFMAYTFYAGWLWMTAQGNSSTIEKAQGILKNSIIGMVVIMFAYTITSFVFSAFLNPSSSLSDDNDGVQTDTSAATEAAGARVVPADPNANTEVLP